MRNDFINPYGVQASINCNGILLSYSVDSNYIKELFFSSENDALKLLKVKSINDITGNSLIKAAWQNKRV